jgi:hypothetical protein
MNQCRTQVKLTVSVNGWALDDKITIELNATDTADLRDKLAGHMAVFGERVVTSLCRQLEQMEAQT